MSEQEQNTWDSSEGVFNSNKDADSSIIRVWEGEGGGEEGWDAEQYSSHVAVLMRVSHN